MALQKGQRLREAGQFEVAAVGQIKSAGDSADDVADAVARLVVQRGKPEAIKVDNGSEFAGKVMDRWPYENGVGLDFSRRGTPTDNAMVESRRPPDFE
ncbi:UNVERIFIED_ORG: transposase InsO family protein [Xanthomonas axonopodis]